MEEHTTIRTSIGVFIQKFLHVRGGFSLRSVWILTVFVFIVMNAILVIFMGVFFFRVTGGSQGGSGDVPPPAVETIGREGMAQTIDAFEARIQQFESLKTDYEASPDPSR